MSRMRLQWTCTDRVSNIRFEDHRNPSTGSVMVKDSLAQRIAFLRSLPLFANLNVAELRFLAEEAKERTFEAGATLYYQGELGHTCQILTEGKVRVYVVGEDGRELSVCIFGPGEIVGEMALFEDMPRSASVETLEPTRTLELNQAVLLHALQRSPTLALSLLRALSARLRSTTEEAEGLVSMTVSDRLLARLRRLAEWSGRPVEDGVQIVLPMTQQELAALVGTSRESINRALASLRRQDKVRLHDGWIVLLDQDVE